MGADILAQIIEHKKEEIGHLKKNRSEASLRRDSENLKTRRSLLANMATKGSKKIRIIAEIKRASPSKGDICIDLDAAQYSKACEQGGAAAISVLTEQRWFKGRIEDLIAVKQSTLLPVLRKDFIISTYQIYESAVIGADAALLIARILTKSQLTEYLELCESLNLEALVEIHASEDLEKIRGTKAQLIGINNRNLKSFDTDIRTAIEMADRLESHQIAVAASGISSGADIEKTVSAGIYNFLIGESIVRSGNPEIFIRSLLSAGDTVFHE